MGKLDRIGNAVSGGRKTSGKVVIGGKMATAEELKISASIIVGVVVLILVLIGIQIAPQYPIHVASAAISALLMVGWIRPNYIKWFFNKS